MSSTGRTKADGSKTLRHPADFYCTPAFTVHALLEVGLHGLPFDGKWLEPACGNGAIIDAVDGWLCQRQVKPPGWTGIDIRKEAVVACQKHVPHGIFRVGSFLDFKVTPETRSLYDVIITNPPFSLALEFFRHALEFDATVIMLQRLNFLGSMKRREFWQRHMPDVYVLPKRPSFTGGATDSTEYCWFAWGKGAHGLSRGGIEVL